MSNVNCKYVIDTNVPLNANLSTDIESIPPGLERCVLSCVELIERVVTSGGLVIDANGEIFEEYSRELNFSGQPGVGDRFLKWIHDHQWGFPETDRVIISKKGDSYLEFPDHSGLEKFDISDRKFVAVANAHFEKPPIYQATDSKWWGWWEALEMVGIDVTFLCPDYIKEKYEEKMGK